MRDGVLLQLRDSGHDDAQLLDRENKAEVHDREGEPQEHGRKIEGL